MTDKTVVSKGSVGDAQSDVYRHYMIQNQAYFDELERLGPANSYLASNLNRLRESNKLCNVGAKPLSGVRGLYFSKGSWRVKYFDDQCEVMTCFFNYNTEEGLIASFNVAYSFLNRVIEYGRQVKNEDGAVLEKLTNEQLIALDKRKKKKERIIRTHRFEDEQRLREKKDDSDDDYIDPYANKQKLVKVKRKRGRPRLNRSTTSGKYRNISQISATNIPKRKFKRSFMEKQFEKYACIPTRVMIDDMVHPSIGECELHRFNVASSIDDIPSVSFRRAPVAGDLTTSTFESYDYASTYSGDKEGALGDIHSHNGPGEVAAGRSDTGEVDPDTEKGSELTNVDYNKLMELVRLYRFDHCYKK